jgi:hypothetical protein
MVGPTTAGGVVQESVIVSETILAENRGKLGENVLAVRTSLITRYGKKPLNAVQKW